MDDFLNQQVLVLNRLWQAVNICSARRAFSLLYSGHAQVVDASDGNWQTFNFEQWHDFSQSDENIWDTHETAASINFKIPIPKIIVLIIFDKLPHQEVKLTRQNIFERDRYICQYCHIRFDKKELNIDHVIPRDKGGTTTWENVVCSCISCNTRKGNRYYYEVGMKLLKEPVKPKQRLFLNFKSAKPKHDSWKHFLDFAYWNIELTS